MIAEASAMHPDPIEVALAELELYAADAWSNQAIVERVQHIRRLRQIERIRADVVAPASDQEPDRLVVTMETRWP